MVKQVRLFIVDGDGFKSAGRAVLRNGEVEFEGMTDKQKFTFSDGLCEPTDLPPRKAWFPKDDIRFLELLPLKFRGSYFKASLIE